MSSWFYKYIVVGMLMQIADIIDPIPEVWWKDHFMLLIPAIVVLIDWWLSKK